MRIHDLKSQGKIFKQLNFFYKKADGFILLYDVNSPESMEQALKWLSHTAYILKDRWTKSKPKKFIRKKTIILVANKDFETEDRLEPDPTVLANRDRGRLVA